MLYNKFLKKHHQCPFCHLLKEEVIKQNKYAILTLARAPYTKDHLLIVPKKHVLKLNKLSKKEKQAIEELIYYGLKKLHKKHKNVTVLFREGNKKQVGKSINHIHYHLIPDMKIGSLDKSIEHRQIFAEEKYVEKIKEVRKRLGI
tara:strand:+ start:1224 stop:1658 length:435 start_codon:yes stop_codon:yes gene_type:complete